MVTHRASTIAECAHLSDAELMKLSLSRPDCFGAIFDRHAAEVLRYVHARLGPGPAEDAVAEIFLAAFRNRARYDPARADVLPWLYGIATRVIGKHRRAERQQQRLVQRIERDRAVDDIADRCAERAVADQLRPGIAAAVSRLSRRDRDLLLLIAWAELTYGEAAQALGVPVGTIRSRLNRIRAKMREALGGTSPLRNDQEDGHG
jgi:RNA polymerase sigma factor (sigma-70 family)